MAGIKIVDLPALGRDLAATDLLELSLAGGTGSRKITGQEIINASKLNVGTTPIINGTAGRLLFQSTGNVLSQSGNLFWDNTNERLGIGTSSPTRALDIVKTIASGAIEGIKIEVNHSSSTSAGILDFVHTQFDARFRIQSIAGAGGANPTLSFIVRSSTTAMSILQSGNVNIGNTTTDAGFKLDVNGTARVQGQLTVSSGGAAITGNSTISGYIGTASGGGGGIYGISGNQEWRLWTRRTNTSGSCIAIGDFNEMNGSNINVNIFDVGGSFVTTGTSVLNNIIISRAINLASGTQTVRGFYYNPTLTNTTGLTTHNAIETTAGNVIFNGGNVGIGTSSPVTALSVIGSETSGRAIQVRSSAGKPFVEFFTSVSIGVLGSATAITGGLTNDFGLGTNGNATANLVFGTGAGYSERLRINGSTGNVLINTTTDAGYRLDVNGDTILRRVTFITPNTITGGTEFFRVQSGNGFTPLIRGYENGVLGLGSSSGSIGFGTANFNFITGSNFDFNYVPLNQLNTFALRLTANYTNVGAGGTSQGTMFRTAGSTSTSVGNVTMNQIEMTPAYNNTGGVTTNRGIYYNPTLTSMTNTTHFAIHTTAGRVRFEGLPTSPTGLNAGDLWNDAGTLKIV